MTVIAATLLVALMTLVAAIAGLLVQRRALRESVEQFRLRSDQAPVLIWTARPDTSLDYLNGFCVQLTGRPIEELREKGWLDFVHPEDVDRCLATYMPAFEARTPFLLEYRLRHTNGDYRWFLASGVPKYGPDGSYTGYVGCDIDITERKKSRRSDSVSGRPADRGAGDRAGADRSGPARRRQPAAGWCLDRLQRSQAAFRRASRQ